MLESDFGAAIKFVIVFLGASLFGWISAQCLLRGSIPASGVIAGEPCCASARAG